MTDIIPEADSSFRVNLGDETIKGAQRMFMCRAGESRQIGALINSETNSSYRMFSIYHGDSALVDKSTATSRLAYSLGRYGFWMTCKRWGFGSTSKTFTKGPDTPTGPLIIGQMPSLTGQPYTGKMKTFYVYDDETMDVTTNAGFNDFTPVYSLKPCTYDSEAGLWCEQLQKFYGNSAGSGTLSVENE